jgi:hypothetical protein
VAQIAADPDNMVPAGLLLGSVRRTYRVIVVKPTWEDRDLPVLRAIVELSDEGEWRLSPEQIAERLGFDVDRVKLALFALAAEQPPFFSYSDMSDFEGRDIGAIREPTGHARRTVGTWPRPEERVDQLVEALQAAAEQEPDTERKGALRKVASYAGGVGRDLMVEVMAKVITGG